MVVPLEVARISKLVKGIFQRMVETMAPMVPMPPIWEWAAVERGAQPVKKIFFGLAQQVQMHLPEGTKAKLVVTEGCYCHLG